MLIQIQRCQGMTHFVRDFPWFHRAIEGHVQRDHLYKELVDGTMKIVPGINFMPWDIFAFIDDFIDHNSTPFSGPHGATRNLHVWWNTLMRRRRSTRDSSRGTESRLRQSISRMDSAPFLVLCLLLGVPMPASQPCKIWMPFLSWSSKESSSPPPGQRSSTPSLVIVPSAWDISVFLPRFCSRYAVDRFVEEVQCHDELHAYHHWEKLLNGEQSFPHFCDKGWLKNCKGRALHHWAVVCLYPPHQLLRLHEWWRIVKWQHLWA